MFKQLAGLPDIVHVPYKGANPGLADFYSGHLPMFAASISPQVLEMHKAGRMGRVQQAQGRQRDWRVVSLPIAAVVVSLGCEQHDGGVLRQELPDGLDGGAVG